MRDDIEVRSNSTVLPDSAPSSAEVAEDGAASAAAVAKSPGTAEQTESCLAARLAAVGELPPAVLAFLVRAVAPRTLWTWLGHEERARLLLQVTRGFQSNPRALNQPPVRKRLEHHLGKNPDDVAELIELWSDSAPAVLQAVRDESPEALPASLARLWRRFGGEALLLSLLATDCEDATLEAYLGLDAESIGESDGAADTNSQTDVLTEASNSTVLAAAETTAEERLAALERERETASSEAQTARIEAQAAGERAQNLSTELSAIRARASREVQTATADARKNQRRAGEAEVSLAETKKLLDRTARRQRHVETERDELAAENKRLKKQLRQAQQIQEELRKQLANANARLAQNEPKTQETSASEPQPEREIQKPSPADTTFVWVSDGRRFSVTPRDVAKAVNTNDEDFIFGLMQSFEALREKNDDGLRLFRKSVRDLDPYYERVLTRDTTRVLVDASNVVRYEVDGRGRGALKALVQMREELRRRDCFPISMIADASLKYFIDRPNELVGMANRGELTIVDKGVEADEILAREARRSGAYVVTNDRGFHHKVSPDFEPPRITFRFIDGLLIVDDF